jgi:hypothetical protein
MPALGAANPAHLRVHACAKLGLLLGLAQHWQVDREGGSSGYPIWSQEEQESRGGRGSDMKFTHDEHKDGGGVCHRDASSRNHRDGCIFGLPLSLPSGGYGDNLHWSPLSLVVAAC